MWLRNEVKAGAITVDITTEKGVGKIGAQIVKADTKIKPIISGDKVEIEVQINAEVKIYENSSNLDLSNPKTIYYVEDKFAEDIKKVNELALKKAQKEYNSDVLGFGTEVYRSYPENWNNYYKEHWGKEFSHLKVNIDCNVKAPDIGIDNRSLTRTEEEVIKR